MVISAGQNNVYNGTARGFKGRCTSRYVQCVYRRPDAASASYAFFFPCAATASIAAFTFPGSPI